MVKRGIHPLVNTMTLVLRNGATIQVESILKATRPMRLQIDTTSHPTWTGEKTMTGQDGRAADFMRKFANPGASAAETQQKQQQQQQQQQQE
ncbi:probable 50S ribosomal protein L31 [Coccomyxa sp. Obi]|nr:probable 50S ribosomal protein L31 [Coccomyxa sp. Obi]